MSDDSFEPLADDPRFLTLRQWIALRKCIVTRAHEERNRAIGQMITGIFGMIWRAWRRTRVRQEARAILGSMTDRELWDIGLSRSGIEAAIRRNDEEVESLRGETPADALEKKLNRRGAAGILKIQLSNR